MKITIHPPQSKELVEASYWLGALLVITVLLQLMPAPNAAKGLANYLPLHTMMEILSIVVAGMVFSISWVTQKYRRNGRALILGIGFLGVAVVFQCLFVKNMLMRF